MKLNPYFGRFGGQFVPEILIPALDQLEEAFIAAKDDPTFQQELHTLLTDYAGRPTPLTKCRNLTQGTKTTIYLKREDLVHGGAHKTNQVLGQALLARRMGKLEESCGNLSAVVSGKYFIETGKILGDEETPVTMHLSKTHLKLDLGASTIIIRLLEGDYIKYRQLLPPSYAISVRLDRDQLSDCIDRASLMAREGKSNLLKFSIRQDKLAITSNSEMGDVYEEMDVQTTGKDIDIAFNVRYISEAVRSIDETQFLLNLNSNISPCVLVPTEGEDFLYLVLPVRTAI